MLFDKGATRTDAYRAYSESDWEYLNRSNRAESTKVREFLERWLAEYPETDKSELCARMRSHSGHGFKSAVFELIIFALLRASGCSVELHPALEGSSKRPDFLINTPDGARVYIEAVIATEATNEEVSGEKRTNVILDAVGKVKSPNFFIWVDIDKHPKTPPNTKRLRRHLERWVASLDPDVVTQQTQANNFDALPETTWTDGEWSIEFRAIPIKSDRRNQGQRVVGGLSHGADWLNNQEAIRSALKAKGSRYGKLPYPLVVAVNLDGVGLHQEDEMQALFGDELYRVDSLNLAKPIEMDRHRNGLWFGPHGPQYERISGAWIFGGLNGWTISSARNTLYSNPYSTVALPPIFEKFNHARPVGREIKVEAGKSIASILGLPNGWPLLPE